MVDVSGGLVAGPRRRRIVEETLGAGASVARVALKHEVNANQVFQWRRLYRDGKLGPSYAGAIKLLLVSVVEDQETSKAAVSCKDLCWQKTPVRQSRILAG
jgi:transposase